MQICSTQKKKTLKKRSPFIIFEIKETKYIIQIGTKGENVNEM